MLIQVTTKGHYKFSNLKAIVNATEVKPETIYVANVYSAALNSQEEYIKMDSLYIALLFFRIFWSRGTGYVFESSLKVCLIISQWRQHRVFVNEYNTAHNPFTVYWKYF